MNSIVALCRVNPEKAREVLLELSNYLRGNFDFNSTEKFIPLDKELSHVKSYLAIEKERFSDRLTVLYEIDKNINLLIPPLLLQPLVENAVRHGLMRRLEGGIIKISVRDMEDHILLRVEDDGVGMGEEKLVGIFGEKGESVGTSVGLLNISKRMKALYGYGPDIKSGMGKGTTVEMRIPKQKG